MAETLDDPPLVRRRRSDAQRNIDAIVSGARTLLSERSDASMEDIAAASGLTRQTVYAHFPSRDVLIAAVINAERAKGLAAVDASQLDRLPPVDALRRFLEISWQIVDRCPLVLDPTLARTPGPDGGDPHRPVTAVLERIIRRGQRSGDFDRTLPAGWLAAATFGLGHAAAEQVAAGKLSIAKATTMLDTSVLRLYGAKPSTTAGAQPDKE
jgi:AcrR family transcriptional regulator